MPETDDKIILPFATPAEFRAWLFTHHATHPGVWIKFAKKASGIPSVTYAEALDEALCVGWIDGPVRKLEEPHWIHKFMPRRPRSIWSKRNQEHVERLTREGRMLPAGQAAIDAAKADGRWASAYAPPTSAEVPDDFVAEVSKNPKAKAFFDSRNKTNRFAIYFRLHTAKKPETRARRFQQLLEMMKRGEKIH
jgi:uncharacterized protein YdeI (YjbR/CyaY-like superfamily)